MINDNSFSGNAQVCVSMVNCVLNNIQDRASKQLHIKLQALYIYNIYGKFSNIPSSFVQYGHCNICRFKSLGNSEVFHKLKKIIFNLKKNY